MKVVVSPSTFNTLKRGAHQQSGEDDGGGVGGDCGGKLEVSACIYEEEGYVSGAHVVPFSWEEKPGVPLNGSKYTTTTACLEAMRGKRELGPPLEEDQSLTNMDVARWEATLVDNKSKEEKALVISGSKHSANMLSRSDHMEIVKSKEVKALALTSTPLIQHSSTNHMLFPLPPPPNSSLPMPTSNVGALSNGFSDHSKPSTPSTLFNSSTNLHTHIKKHRASSFSPFLNISVKSGTNSSSSTNCSGKSAYALKDDPFLRAIQACTQASTVAKQSDVDDKKSNQVVGAPKNSSAAKNSGIDDNMGGIRESELHSKYKNSSSATMAKDAGNVAAKSAVMKRGVEGSGNNIRIRGTHGAIGVSRAPMMEGSCSSYTNGGNTKGIVYDGHPAFMVAAFQQKKKPIASIKDSPRHRSTGYGWLSCRNVDSHDSIIRIDNPRSSFS